MEERHEVAGKRCWAGDLTHGGEARSGWEEVLGGVAWPLNAGGGWVWAWGNLTHGGEARSGWEEVLGGVAWPLNAGGGWVWAGSGGRWGGSLVPDETVRMGKPFTLG